MKPLLLLVDFQNDFVGAPGLEPSSAEVTRRAVRLLAGARDLGVPVVHAVTSVSPDGDDRMPHWKRLGRALCVRGTQGHAAPAGLEARAGEAVVSKTFFSAFSSRDLEAALAETGADTILVSGVHLHGCVRATVLDAYQRGFEVWIAEDAVASDDPLHAAVTRRYLDGRAARFATVEEILAALPGAARAAPERGACLPVAVIAGREVQPDSSDRLEHRSPRDRADRLFEVPVAGARESTEAAAAALGAGGAWRRLAPDERSRRLSKLAEILDAAAPSLARDCAVDVGKPISQGEAEVRRAAMLVRIAAEVRPENGRRSGPESAFRRVPLGVVAVVTPWNNPIAIPWGKIAPALAFGNTVAWKPAPAATRLALRTLEAAREAGLPDGVVNLVAGDHRTAAALMSAPGIDAVSLSGSSLAGWTAQEICARRRIPLQAELGGNNASIVWEGANLVRAAARVASGAFGFAGQRCTANRRAIVDAHLFDEFLDHLTAAVRALRWGDPLDPSTEVGPLISEDARRRVAGAVDRSRALAERVLSPHESDGRADELREAGAYYAPTIVVAPPHESEIVQTETFGPVLVVERARDFDEALRLANGVRQGLVASLFAGSETWRERFHLAAEAGILKWNSATDGADALAPFGGWKGSGVGPPEHGPGDEEFYTRFQAIYGED